MHDQKHGQKVSGNGGSKQEAGGSNKNKKAQKPDTRLQQHIDYWDRDGDRIIWPRDTFIGFYQLGFGIFLSLLSTLIIHLSFSYPSQCSIIPDPMFRIEMDNVHRLKHGSDTGIYRVDGTFSRVTFDEFFERASTQEKKDSLNIKDTARGLWQQRNVADPFGWIAAAFEWFTVWYLFWPSDGKITKEDVRGIYDGSIFWKIAEARGYKLPQKVRPEPLNGRNE